MAKYINEEDDKAKYSRPSRTIHAQLSGVQNHPAVLCLNLMLQGMLVLWRKRSFRNEILD